MNAGAQRVFDTFQQPRGVICSVCATLAAQSGVPVLLIRAAAVILLIAHGLLTIVVYLLAAAWMRRPPKTWQASRWSEPDTGTRPRPEPPRDWHCNELHARFHGLDERLARMEAETYRNEAGLRRAFHDLERHD